MEISDTSHAGEARRVAVKFAEASGLGEEDRSRLAIIITELATNILKHAGRGTIICEAIWSNKIGGLRIISVDQGPGIRNVALALQDGYSTSGTNGSGLGAVQRLSKYFEVYSQTDRGTCVLSDFWPQKKTPIEDDRIQVGTVSIALRGEGASGDGWAVKPSADHTSIMVVDGLGHGAYAAEAAREAERVFLESEDGSPATMLRNCHDALKKTRGAAASFVTIASDKGTLSFAGLGNVSSTLITQTNRRGMASHNGTLGHQMSKVQEFTFPWQENSILIMHSDGLTSRWDLDQYPGITNRHPSIIAAVLYRDFKREKDDATVLVVKAVR